MGMKKRVRAVETVLLLLPTIINYFDLGFSIPLRDLITTEQLDAIRQREDVHER
jgi:hypothetical protein